MRKFLACYEGRAVREFSIETARKDEFSVAKFGSAFRRMVVQIINDVRGFI